MRLFSKKQQTRSAEADPRHDLGLRGEDIAERFLRKLGMKLLVRRYRAAPGELDLIFQEKQTIVFVEVKTQTDRRLLDPHERVNSPKRRKLIKAARWFLNERKLSERPCRFDVVSVTMTPDCEPMIEHFPEAFIPPRG